MALANIRVNANARFPVQMRATGGLKVTKVNGIWTLQPDFSALAAITSLPDPATKQVWVYDPLTGIYNVLTLAAIGASLFIATSVTSLAVGAGSKTFTISANKLIAIGQTVLITSQSDPANIWMLGQVTAYSGTSLTVNVTSTSGAGTHADWTISTSGAQGVQGISNGSAYVWSTDTTATDPGAGLIKVNNAALASATAIYMSETDNNGGAIAALIASWGTGSSTIKAKLRIFAPAAPQNFAVYNVTAAVTDNGTWDNITVTYVAGNGSFSNGQTVYVTATNTGDKGDTGATGAAGANGANGVNPGVFYAFDTSTVMAAPAAGGARFNNATISAVTAIALNAQSVDNGNPNMRPYVLTWDDSTTTAHRGQLIIRKASAPENFAVFDITGAITDNTTWLQLAVTYINGSGSFAAADVLSMQAQRTGDAGSGSISGGTVNGIGYATGASAMTSTAALTDGQVVVGKTGNVPQVVALSGDVGSVSNTGSVTLATTQSAAHTWSKPQTPGAAALTSGVAADFSAAQLFTVNVNGSTFTIANPSVNPATNTYIAIAVTFTTANALAFGTNFKVTGYAQSFSNKDHLVFYWNGTTYELVMVRNGTNS